MKATSLGLAGFGLLNVAAAPFMLARVAWGMEGDRTFRYAIIMEKDKIGEETYHISQQNGATKVDVTTDSHVSMLFLSYTYHHTHSEIWRDGKLDSYVADTNDDGEIHHIQAHRSGDAILAQLDAKPEARLSGDAAPFSIWHRDDMTRTSVFSIIDLDPMKVRAEDKGTEPVSVGGGTTPAERFHMSGDEVRDLWYGSDGILLKTAFKHIGYNIQFVKE